MEKTAGREMEDEAGLRPKPNAAMPAPGAALQLRFGRLAVNVVMAVMMPKN
jgi:hypothetical protein